jgi:hypothetical protein
MRESKQIRRQCASCRERKARFQYGGTVRADRDHTLCFACFRAERERRRARDLAVVAAAVAPRSPFGRALSEQEREHRRVMLAFAASMR